MPWRHRESVITDEIPASYNVAHAKALGKKPILCRPPLEVLLFLAGLSFPYSHPELCRLLLDADKKEMIFMDFLDLPSFDEGIVDIGEPYGENEKPTPRVTDPLPVGQEIPKLTPVQQAVEKPSARILEAKQKQEKNPKVRKASSIAEGSTSNKRVKRKGRQTVHSESEADSQKTHSTQPISVAKPNSQASAGGSGLREKSPSIVHVSDHSSPHAEHDSQLAGEGFEPPNHVPNWRLNEDVRVNSNYAAKEFLYNLATPADDQHLKAMSIYDILRHSCRSVAQSTIVAAELMKRYKKLNSEYVDMANSHFVEKESFSQGQELLSRLKVSHQKLKDSHSTCTKREEELNLRIRTLEEENEVLKKTATKDTEQLSLKIHELIDVSGKLSTAETNNKHLTVLLSQAEVDKQMLIRDAIPGLFRKLIGSYEYRKALGAACSVAFSAGFMKSAGLGRTLEQVKKVLSKVKNIKRDALKTWVPACDALFDTSYPFVDKISSSYSLSIGDLLQLEPECGPSSSVASELPSAVASDITEKDVEQSEPSSQNLEGKKADSKVDTTIL